MLSSLLSEHIRRLNILVQLNEGQVEFPLYKPGEALGPERVAGYDYSGKIVNLRLQARRPLRLDFWLQNPIGIRWFIARNVDAKNEASLLVQDIKAGLYLASDILLGCSLAQGQRLSPSDEVSIYGFAEERGVSMPRLSSGGAGQAAWGSIQGNIAEQEDIINLLDGKVDVLELNEALTGVDAQAESLENLVTAAESSIVALAQGEPLPIVSATAPSNPSDGTLWREISSDTGQPFYSWLWRWEAGPARWVSHQSWLQAALTDVSSGFRSGEFASRYPRGFAQIWVPSVRVWGFVNTGANAATWRLKIQNLTGVSQTQDWLSILTEGRPYNQLWEAAVTVNQLIAANTLSFAHRIEPIISGGNCQFHLSFPVHVVRPI